MNKNDKNSIKKRTLLLYVSENNCVENIIKFAAKEALDNDLVIKLVTNINYEDRHALISFQEKISEDHEKEAKNLLKQVTKIIKSQDDSVEIDTYIHYGTVSAAIMNVIENDHSVYMILFCLVHDNQDSFENINYTLNKMKKKNIFVPALIMHDNMTEEELSFFHRAQEKEEGDE